MFRKFMLTAAILTIPTAAIAHHGWTSYDEKKVIKVRAALTDVKWAIPMAPRRFATRTRPGT